LEDVTINDFICASTGDYTANGFNIPAASLQEGVNVFTQIFPAAVGGGCDQNVTLNLTVSSTIHAHIYDTICAGLPYTDYNFSIASPVTREYVVNDLMSSVAGCDSAVHLHLVVLPSTYTATATACQGTPYVFGQQTLTASGTYTETFTSTHGCDSTVTLTLTVVPTAYEISEVLCAGDTVYFDSVPRFTTGDYTATFPRPALGCDSTVTLHLTVSQPVTVEYSASFCSGTAYYGYGWSALTEPGNYTHTDLSVSGCDSVTILHLTRTETITVNIDTAVCNGDAFYIGGNPYTLAGTYSQTIPASTGCDSTVNLTLSILPTYTVFDTVKITTAQLPYDYKGLYTVEAGASGYVNTIVNAYTTSGCDSLIYLNVQIATGLWLPTTDAADLKIYPNPVRRSETVYLDYTFSESQKEGLVVEMFNTLGERVMSRRPDIYPITLSNLPAAGVYVVRVTGANLHLVGKLIVED